MGTEITRVSAVGPRRRLQALRRLGWTIAQLAELTRLHPHTIRAVSNHRNRTVTPPTAAAVHRAYEDCWDRPPPTRRAEEVRAVEQARLHAIEMGWAPAMAWDNIDDPDEAPQGVRPLLDPVQVTAEEAVQLLQAGLSPHEVAKRMGVKVESLSRRLRRHGWHRWAAACERKLPC